MALETADRACDRCRERRVKCDKRQPKCARCEKLGKPCPGYDKKRKFVDEGVSLRRKFQTQESNKYASRDNEQGFASPPPEHGQHHHAGPADLTALQPVRTMQINQGRIQPTTEPTNIQTDIVPGMQVDLPYAVTDINTDDVLDDIMNDPSFDPAWFNLDPGEFYSKTNNSCGFIPNIPNIVDEVDRNDFVMAALRNSVTPGDEGTPLVNFDDTWAQGQFNTSAIITDEREHEMAYLIRHFTEAIGPWMDLFDRDKHFAQVAPLKALRDALLRNAIAAVAAKQLGRTQGSKPFLSIQSQQPATMEVINEDVAIDWFYKAANYYDKAIACSRVYLQALSGTIGTPGTPSTQVTLSTANSDDLLVAVSIFSLYESLDSGEIGWLQHLAGLKSLLTAMSPEQHPHVPKVTPAVTVGRRASFWNFARADYQAAYVKNQKTYLDTEDLSLWRSCGLQVQDDGSLYQDASLIKNEPLDGHETAELVSHTILWIVLRVMNYLNSKLHCTNIRQASNEWRHLVDQLETWYQNRPATFQPCAQIKRSVLPKSPSSQSVGLIEVFFSINACAAAMQLYHFARILLLLNNPLHDPDLISSGNASCVPGCIGTSRLHAYRELSSETIKHAHQIVGIALGRPHPAVRVEMLLPLFVAGSCLESTEEREVVLELLRAIEKDTGCSTEVRVNELMKEWQWYPTPMVADTTFD